MGKKTVISKREEISQLKTIISDAFAEWDDIYQSGATGFVGTGYELNRIRSRIVAARMKLAKKYPREIQMDGQLDLFGGVSKEREVPDVMPIGWEPKSKEYRIREKMQEEMRVRLVPLQV